MDVLSTGIVDQSDLYDELSVLMQGKVMSGGCSPSYSSESGIMSPSTLLDEDLLDLLNFTAPGSNDGRYRKRQHE